jgi:hypothetical protein
MGKDVGDSTFAEDSDASPLPPPRSRPPKDRARKSTRTGGRGLLGGKETGEETDGLTDLERRVRALKIWGEVEEGRKDWLLNELHRRNVGEIGSLVGRRSASVSSASGEFQSPHRRTQTNL